MKISKLQIENFRLLKNFSMDLEEDLSLVIGKNNTGKTSILFVLDKFFEVYRKELKRYSMFAVQGQKKI